MFNRENTVHCTIASDFALFFWGNMLSWVCSISVQQIWQHVALCILGWCNRIIISLPDSTRIWDSAYTGQIRLSSGQYSNEGLLEIYCNGQWGTVCDDFFGPTDATVACRQLGYNTYYSYLPHTVWVLLCINYNIVMLCRLGYSSYNIFTTSLDSVWVWHVS